MGVWGKKPTAANGKEIQSEMLLREAANLKTRKNKPKVTSAERLLKGWKAFVQLKGFELPELPELLGEGVAITPALTGQLASNQVAAAESNLKPAIQHCGEAGCGFSANAPGAVCV